MATPTTLPATFVSSNVLTAASMNDLRGAFRVLQVVYGTTDSAAANSTTTYADTGLTATITPSDVSSKVLVIVQQNGCGKEAGSASSELQIQLLRTSTQIGFASGGGTNVSEVSYFGTIGMTVLDSPATTSAVTYKTQFKNYVAAASVRVQTGSIAGNRSTIILMEISA